MQTMATHGDVQVAGVGVSVRSIGPALAGSHHRAIVLAVTGPDGAPRGGLTAADFTVQLLVQNANSIAARAADPESVVEPTPGVYVLALEQPAGTRPHHAFACVVDVRDGKSSRQSVARLVVGLDL
jgi:hypothetical protein